MNRSFICGMIIASLTWSISLYLYWILLHNSDTEKLSVTIVAPVQSKRLSNNNFIDSNDGKHLANNQFYLDKVQRYKKEQKFRKISQKLIDELQPIKSINNGLLHFLE